MTRMLRTVFLVLSFALVGASPSAASFINASVLVDTPEMWTGFIDWTDPVVGSAVTIDGGPNWTVGVVEVPTGGGLAVLVVTARHLVEPHAPPSPLGIFLATSFGPLAPGGTGSSTDTDAHADDQGHFDELVAELVAVNASTSRLNITLAHRSANVPEPATGVLILGGLLAAGMLRRRSNC